jgi:prepilin-type N-terminal cleavage/methylation domain-containing protein
MRYPNSKICTGIRGFTLTELAIVLGIVGLILGGIWVSASAVYNSIRASHATNQLLLIAQNARTLFGSQTSIPAGFLTDPFVKAGVIPSDVPVVPTGILSPWGTLMQIASQSGWGVLSNINAYEIVYWGLNANQCASLLSPLLGPGQKLGLTLVYVDGTGQFDPKTTPPLTALRCGGGGVTVNVVLQFSLVSQ